MPKKQFKAESKKLLDMMINSIYTNKDIFLRELISNASDAIDKLYYHSLSGGESGLSRDEFKIEITADKDSRTLTIEDNGCGMTKTELEENLGTIAHSGSLDFKSGLENKSEVEIIGQFGVGFYSAFMVSESTSVISRAYGSDEAYVWQSAGADGYTIKPCEKEGHGTKIVLKIKENTEEQNYDKYLEQYGIEQIVKKYSDYIRYPIIMEKSETRLKPGSEDEYETVTEPACLNSMVPLWRKNKNEISEQEYNDFYKSKFYDYEDAALTIHSKTEGQVSYDALLFIPSHAPFDYYTKSFEKGLALYSNGVLIMEKCEQLLPDHFSFVRGLVDSADLSLNISRELLQQDHVLKVIAKALEKKIKSELLKMLKNDRERYEKFYEAFGLQLKYGVYSGYGINKDMLSDLLMFYSSSEKKLVTLDEYCQRMGEEQKSIYFACGETYDKIDLLPQSDAVKDRGFEILYCVNDVDEFALKMLREYNGKSFTNICADNLDLSTQEEKNELEQENKAAEEMFAFIKQSLSDKVSAVRYTNKLKNYPVCLTSEGEVSLEMEKVLNSMPGAQSGIKAELVLEINRDHEVATKLRQLFVSDKDKLSDYAVILYSLSCLIAGKSVENPAKLSELVCGLM